MEQFASPSSDNAGNRTSKKTYAYTTGTLGTVISTENYEYDGDRLTRVGSMQYTYDTIGNPTYYNGYTLEWEGRRLTRMSMNGGQFVYEFAYNADGIRTMKRSSGTPHVYALNGTQILTETIGNKLLVYLYDESGAPIGMQYRTTSYAAGQYDTYFFEKNLQGDIIAVYTENGTKIGSYTYDAWGNCTYVYTAGATSAQKQIISTLNPFRYRGYYYDTETGLYYLQTRYYSPQWGRFLNADGYVNANGDLIGFNMYAYCSNNPVMYMDSTGEIAITTIILITACVAGALAALYTAYVEYEAGSSASEIVLDSVVMGLSAFCTVYSFGMYAYQFYEQCCYYYGWNFVTDIKFNRDISSQLQHCANKANDSISGTGAVVGTQKHTMFAREVNKLNNQQLKTEVSFLNGEIVPYGTKGSVRFDVVQFDSNNNPVMAWDFKTGAAVLNDKRISEMQSKSGLNIPINMIK